MLLPQTKEREYRFKLALRIGLPIFGLILALISHTFVTTYETLQLTFYIESAILLIVSIYFIFYLIYHGFNVNITDRVTNTFSNEYLMKYLTKEISQDNKYTLILVSVDNIQDINTMYTIQNGDKVLLDVSNFVCEYFEGKGVYNFAIGHLKSGDFLLGFKGIDSNYKTLLELMCLKMLDYKVDDIEVKISSAIVDTSYSNQLDFLVEYLFELQKEKKKEKKKEIDPSELESLVINSIKDKNFVVGMQSVFSDGKSVIKECFIKLKTKDAKLLYPKSYMKVLQKHSLTVKYDLMILEYILDKVNDDEILAFSISPTSLRNPIFLSQAKEIIGNKLNDKKRISIILSEIEYYANIKRYNIILNSLRDLGVYITIDRLGSLHTSFLYLRDLDIDIVRFDSFYTKEFKENKFIIEGFHKMAHTKGVKSWIKMVENEETKDYVREIGIDYIQGKYLAQIDIK